LILHVLLATSWLDPIVNGLSQVIFFIHRFVPNLGWCLVILAALVRLVFWQLNTAQFKAMIAMQKIAPQLKKLQEKYGKSDPQRYQQETMALYKSAGANPLAGCWPMLVQYPIIIAVFYVVTLHKDLYAQTGFLWVGSQLAHLFPSVIAANLSLPDWPLLVMYAASLYVSMRYTTMPPSDPAQAQQLKIMQIISPLMFGFFAIRTHWPSAMILYWFAYNVFTMGQQLYLLRRYHQPLSAIDSDHAVTETMLGPAAAALPSSNGEQQSKNVSPNGSNKSGSRKRKKKGAPK
jgi:YidC/Oxa1 family membrane protein insertase